MEPFEKETAWYAQDEHFGIVPLEAMAAHKPIIACNSGGPVETVKDGITGFLCDPTPEEFSLGMAKLIADPVRAEAMGEDARKHVESSFSTEIFGQRLNQCMLDAAKRRKTDWSDLIRIGRPNTHNLLKLFVYLPAVSNCWFLFLLSPAAYQDWPNVERSDPILSFLFQTKNKRSIVRKSRKLNKNEWNVFVGQE